MPHDVDLTLSGSSLHELGERGLRVPGYERSRLQPRVLHIGVGGFHRAHLAMYLDQLAEQGSDWGICGVGLLPHDQKMADALGAQEFLYTFTELGPGEPVTHVIGSIIDFVMGATDPEPVVERIARAETAIVSMTVSESGYVDSAPNNRTFDVIAAGLGRRRAAGNGGLTALSCDNLPGNGAVARRCVLAAAERLGSGLAEWVDQECSFPSSMVDRITPQTKDVDRERLRETYGLEDRWPVVGEPFWQWVLEDDFAAGRPAFDAVGALFSDDVRAWELYKLRLLNAGHSSIAYAPSQGSPTSTRPWPPRRFVPSSRVCCTRRQCRLSTRSRATRAKTTPGWSSSDSRTPECETRSPGSASTAHPSSRPS
jgi:mannitol 2-dehydrogenase